MEAHTAITRRVLVLGSDAANIQQIEDATRAWMFETVVCSSLRSAKELLAEKDFAVIFCDERFVDGTYSDLLSGVRGSSKTPVAVMISDIDHDYVFREAVELGAFGVIPSPCSIKDVQWMVIRAVEHGTSPKCAPNLRSVSVPAVNGLRRGE